MDRRAFSVSALAFAACATTPSGGRKPEAWISGKIAAPGGQVYWRAYGTGKKPTLFCVHGGPDGASSKLYEVLAPFADGRRIAMWDQLDCGESDKPGDPKNWRLARFVEEMDAVRAQIAPGPIHVFGGSWGSALMAEWYFARQPKDVISLMFQCPMLAGERVEVARRESQRSPDLSPETRKAFEELANGRPGPALGPANAEYARRFIMKYPPRDLPPPPPGPPRIGGALSAELRSYNRAADLPKANIPILFMRGEFDYVRDEDIRFYAAQCRESKYVTIKDAAHLAFVDKPAESMAIMRDFMRNSER